MSASERLAIEAAASAAGDIRDATAEQESQHLGWGLIAATNSPRQ